MNTSIILSKLRVHIRLRNAGYDVEKYMVCCVKKFFEEMSISHSSQIQEWHKEAYLSRLKNIDEYSNEEILQTKSTLLYLYKNILGRESRQSTQVVSYDSEPAVFKITA